MRQKPGRQRGNRFIDEVRQGDGIGLSYETSTGRTGVVWLIRPSDRSGSKSPKMTVLGQYLHSAQSSACPKCD